MQAVETSAGTVAYQVTGEGKPVVLLHANLHDHHDYDGAVARIAQRYQTIAVDWPGHGYSPGRPGQAVTATVLAAALAELADALDLEPAVFVGNSVGGYAAARLAIDRPERVAGLVLVNAGGFTGRGPALAVWSRILGTPAVNRLIYPGLVPRYMAARGDDDRRIAAEVRARAGTRGGARLSAGLWRSFGDPSYDLLPRAASITVPAMVVWGLRDPVFPPGAGEQTAAAIPGATLRTFDTGHVVFASDPEGFADALLPFIDASYQRTLS